MPKPINHDCKHNLLYGAAARIPLTQHHDASRYREADEQSAGRKAGLREAEELVEDDEGGDEHS